MARQAYDQWKVPKTMFNKAMTFYVQCDCGELAKTVYETRYFECSHCGRNYVQKFGEYVEDEKKKPRSAENRSGWCGQNTNE